MPQAASIIESSIQGAVDDALSTMINLCPVRTGFLQSTIGVAGNVSVTEYVPRLGAEDSPSIDSQVEIGGDTDYMEYVDTYHAAVAEAANSAASALGGFFSATYEINPRRRRQRRQPRQPRGRRAQRRRLREEPELLLVEIDFFIGDYVEVSNDDVAVYISYASTVTPTYQLL